jgi:hypothetical protein
MMPRVFAQRCSVAEKGGRNDVRFCGPVGAECQRAQLDCDEQDAVPGCLAAMREAARGRTLPPRSPIQTPERAGRPGEIRARQHARLDAGCGDFGRRDSNHRVDLLGVQRRRSERFANHRFEEFAWPPI